MNKLTLFFVIIIYSCNVSATGLPSEVIVTSDNAVKLGFTLKTKFEGKVKTISLTGPTNLKEVCTARSFGSVLFDSNNNEIMLNINRLSNSAVDPNSFGYTTNSKNKLGIFIVYLCKFGDSAKSIRYVTYSH